MKIRQSQNLITTDKEYMRFVQQPIVFSIQIKYYQLEGRKQSKMDQQQIIVCEKHQKKQRSFLQIPSNYFICMNRYCPHAYSILCSSCKLEHRDHQVKILSIEDMAFLIDRLLKMPFRQAGIFIVESVQILKKLKLVSQFANKITSILVQLQQQTLEFISLTQNIVSQYAQCKTAAIEISQKLADLDSKQSLQQLKLNINQKLSKIDYNIQKDRLEYGNLEIKEKEDTRKKNLTFVKRRIEEIKQYSMKIIEVILNNDQSDEEEQDFVQKKRNYQILKAEIRNLAQTVAVQVEDKQKKTEEIVLPIKEDKAQSEAAIETDNKWIQQFEKNIRNLESQLQAERIFQKKIETDFRTKLYSYQKDKEAMVKQRQIILKQRQNLRKQKDRIQKLYEQKCQFFKHYEGRLRDNFQKRSVRYKQRQELIKQLSQLIQHQRVDSRGRQSAQKENRTNSKSKKN